MHHFLESPFMSTYLLVWVIGMFDYLETTSKAGVRVRVYTPPGRKADAEFALPIAAQCLDFYSEFFGIPYPLKKLDLVAVHSKSLERPPDRDACEGDGELGVHKFR